MSVMHDDDTRRREVARRVRGAGPTSRVGTLVDSAQHRGYAVCVIATSAAKPMLDLDALAEQTGRPVRTSYHSMDRLPRADAVIVAPATYNTINKWAAGIADTYPLTLLAELTGIALPIVVLPFVNSALTANRVFTRSIEDLRTAGVRVLFGPGQFEPHPPGTGSTRLDGYPWQVRLEDLG
jgi:hypothetical protein